MFRVDNLVFNKIGNSISVMIFSEENGLQIWDKTDFVVLSAVFSLKGVCVKDFIEFIFEIVYNDKSYPSKLYLSDKNSYLQLKNKIYKINIEDEKISIEIEEPNILFNLSMKNLNNITVKNNKAEIGEKNFFHGITEFLIEVINAEGI